MASMVLLRPGSSIDEHAQKIMPDMPSRIQTGNDQAGNPVAWLGFLRSRPASYRASVIV